MELNEVVSDQRGTYKLLKYINLKFYFFRLYYSAVMSMHRKYNIG